MQIYLDNSATTCCFQSVKEIMNEVMDSAYGNPSSMHMYGVRAEQYIKEAKEIIAKQLKVSEKEIYFTSGGTESDNLALIGCAMANKRAGNHLITNATEHPAVLETMKYLETQGFKVTYLKPDQSGRIQKETLKEALTDQTILVSIMFINNEIGALQPIEELAQTLKAYNPKILFHVDAVQGFGKVRIYPKKMGIDLLSVSGHKIHGPKGIGFLYVKENVKIHPIQFGGGQQKGLRSGTENVYAIAGLGKAAEEIYRDFDQKINKLYELKEYFIKELQSISDVRMNGLIENDINRIRETAPHIVSVAFTGIKSEVMLHALESREIYVSSGSACASNKPAVSETLKAIGLGREHLDSTIRFSFSVMTTKEELEKTIQAIKEQVLVLRKYTRH